MNAKDMKSRQAHKKEENKIWFKFNEGFSNAVRRTVYVKEFL